MTPPLPDWTSTFASLRALRALRNHAGFAYVDEIRYACDNGRNNVPVCVFLLWNTLFRGNDV